MKLNLRYNLEEERSLDRQFCPSAVLLVAPTVGSGKRCPSPRGGTHLTCQVLGDCCSLGRGTEGRCSGSKES